MTNILLPIATAANLPNLAERYPVNIPAPAPIINFSGSDDFFKFFRKYLKYSGSLPSLSLTLLEAVDKRTSD